MFSIQNSRLIVEPISLEEGQNLLINKIRYPLDKEWPSDALRSILPFYLELLEMAPDEYGFGPWKIKCKSEDTVVGDIGFKGKPINGVVELGYYVLPQYRNQNIASEAVGLLSQWAFEQGIIKIIATCDQANKPSQLVLFNNDFKRLGKEGDFLWFEKNKSDVLN